MDMNMLTLFNAREREEEDWVSLFLQADERFSFTGTKRVAADSASAIIVATWEP